MTEQSYAFIPLPEREPKPREQELTLVLDNGMGFLQLQDLVEDAASYMDVIEFGYGVARLFSTTSLAHRIEFLHNNNLRVSTGGTLLELSVIHGRVDDFFIESKEQGFDFVKVSAKNIDVTLNEKIQLIQKAKECELEVISNIGEERETQGRKYTIEEQIEYANASLQEGAWKVTVDSRYSGQVGVYDSCGIVQENYVRKLIDEVGLSNLIFEAPLRSQRIWFFEQYGNQVNLGAISPRDVIPLETLRIGLRPETMKHHHIQ